MILTAPTLDLIRHLNVQSGADLRKRLIEYFNNERMRLMAICASADMGAPLYRAQGAYSALLDLEAILVASPASHSPDPDAQGAPTQYLGGQY